MPRDRSAESKRYREKKIAEMGLEAFKAEEARKRKERRDRAAGRQPEQKEEKKEPSIEWTMDDVYKMKVEQAKKKGHSDYRLEPFKKVYNKFLRVIEGVGGLTDLRNTKKVVKFILNNWDNKNTQIAYISALSSILSVIPKFEKEYQYYSKVSVEMRTGQKKETDNNVKDSTFVEFNDISKAYEKFLRDSDDNESKALMGLYVLIPPRRADVGSLVIIKEGSKMDDDKNYLVVSSKGRPAKLIYQKYKTSAKFGKVKINVPDSLKKILYEYLKEQKKKQGSYLFSTKGENMRKGFDSHVSKTFEKLNLGKKITINTLRHSYITYFLSKNPSMAAKKSVGKLMGHSWTTQAEYERV